MFTLSLRPRQAKVPLSTGELYTQVQTGEGGPGERGSSKAFLHMWVVCAGHLASFFTVRVETFLLGAES